MARSHLRSGWTGGPARFNTVWQGWGRLHRTFNLPAPEAAMGAWTVAACLLRSLLPSGAPDASRTAQEPPPHRREHSLQKDCLKTDEAGAGQRAGRALAWPRTMRRVPRPDVANSRLRLVGCLRGVHYRARRPRSALPAVRWREVRDGCPGRRWRAGLLDGMFASRITYREASNQVLPRKRLLRVRPDPPRRARSALDRGESVPRAPDADRADGSRATIVPEVKSGTARTTTPAIGPAPGSGD